MKVIIAGSRYIKSYPVVKQAIIESGFAITEIVSGKEPNGVDALGELWAKENEIKVSPFPAMWGDLSHADAVIKRNRYGDEYDAKAGPRRNEQMAQYADALIAIWDGRTKNCGTYSMIKLAEKHKLQIHILRV